MLYHCCLVWSSAAATVTIWGFLGVLAMKLQPAELMGSSLLALVTNLQLLACCAQFTPPSHTEYGGQACCTGTSEITITAQNTPTLLQQVNADLRCARHWLE